MQLKGKTALVTGGALRIGRAICEALASAGTNVIIHYLNSEAEAEALCLALQKQGVSSWTIKADLALRAECESLIGKASKLAGGLDFLINNAAIFQKDTLVTGGQATTSVQFQVNFFAPLQLTRSFAKSVSNGAIINLLDRRITGYGTDCLSYTLSKKALYELTQTAALELAPRIRVNAVAPGATLPPSAVGGKNIVHDLAGHIPLEKKNTPQDVAEAVLFLLGNDAITGQVIYVDGGQHLTL